MCTYIYKYILMCVYLRPCLRILMTEGPVSWFFFSPCCSWFLTVPAPSWYTKEPWFGRPYANTGWRGFFFFYIYLPTYLTLYTTLLPRFVFFSCRLLNVKRSTTVCAYIVARVKVPIISDFSEFFEIHRLMGYRCRQSHNHVYPCNTKITRLQATS